MSETTTSIQRKIKTANDLHSVVNAMKTLAASSISQYQRSVISSENYYQAVKLGLGECLRNSAPILSKETYVKHTKDPVAICIVFGSDQGLVGQFNQQLSEFVAETLCTLPGQHHIYVVGERMHARLSNANINTKDLFSVPSSVKLIAPLIGKILIESKAGQHEAIDSSIYIFHNKPTPKVMYTPTFEKIFPLDIKLQSDLIRTPWPTKILPEIIGDNTKTLRALIREYLFILFYRACAESLASENTSRLAAMERADENIQKLKKELLTDLNQMRQRSIDEELFDVVAGFESLS